MPPDFSELLIWLVPLLLFAGAFAGLLAGLLGVGGGVIVVPALFYIFSYLGFDNSIKMHLAVGTSLATIIPTGIRSMRAHQARGSFDTEIFRDWIPAIILGVLLGSWLAALANTLVLTLIFGVVAFFVALQMSFAGANKQWLAARPKGLTRWLMAGTIGTIAAMMGIGGGTLSNPALTSFGMPMHRAVGTSAGFGVVIAITGTLGFIWNGWGIAALPAYSIGYVNWLAFIIVVPAAVISVPLGAKLAHGLSQKSLRRVFAVFLMITAMRMLGDAAGLF